MAMKIGYIMVYDLEMNPHLAEKFKFREATFTRRITSKGDRVYSKMLLSPVDYEEIVDKAYSNGIVEGLSRGIDLMLYVLIDKHDAPMDDVQQLAGELNHAAQCVAEGYVTWADIRQMLKEYGVETALE